MNDEHFLQDWLQETSASASHSNAAADKIVAGLTETRQRSRWWPLRPSRRTAADPPRRTRLMLSPASAITAGVLTFAIGGVMLLAAPLSDRTTLAPGAEAIGSGEVTSFEGFIPYGSGTQLATREAHNGVVTNREQIWTVRGADTSDPRFGGTVSNTWNWNEYGPEGDGYSVWVGGWTIENDDGGWRERPQTTFGLPDGTYPVVTTVFDGVGGYQGLIAIVEVTEDVDVGGFFLRGVITGEPVPPVPTLLQEQATD